MNRVGSGRLAGAPDDGPDPDELRGLQNDLDEVVVAEEALTEAKETVKEARARLQRRARRMGRVLTFDKNIIVVRDDGNPRPRRLPLDD